MTANNQKDKRLPRARIALLIDYDNNPSALPQHASRLMAALHASGEVLVAKAIAEHIAKKDRKLLSSAGIEVLDIQSAGRRKNPGDIALTIEAVSLIFNRPAVNLFVLCTSDSDFAPLASWLVHRGKICVAVATKELIGKRLRESATATVALGRLLAGHPLPTAAMRS